MVAPICCAFDVVALLLGGFVLWRAPWRGALRDFALVGAIAVAALVAIAFATWSHGRFAVARGGVHCVFCVVLPLCALRAVRVGGRNRAWTALLAVAFVAGELCYVWAREVEPFRLEVTHARVTSKRLASLAAPIKVALVADLQTDAIGAWEIAFFDRLVAEAPDLILFAGDYLQAREADGERELANLRAQLRRLTPRLGCYAVDGDVDGPLGGARGVFEGTNVRAIVDERVELAGVPIDVIGLSRAKSRAPFVDVGTVRRLGGERYAIVLGHAPDFMLSVLRDGFAPDALMVAGHTHGGQVQLPWFGPCVTLTAVPRWLAGGGVFRRGDAWLVCSRGIGMERDEAPRIRFLCRPQLIVLELAGG